MVEPQWYLAGNVHSYLEMQLTLPDVHVGLIILKTTLHPLPLH